jgi:hypothetical protein
MVYCVQAELAFQSANRRNNVQAAVETRIEGRSRWSADLVERFTRRSDGAPALRVMLRFVSRADQEDLQARMDALFPANPPLQGSWVRLHDCSHDEGTNSCSVTAERTW